MRLATVNLFLVSVASTPVRYRRGHRDEGCRRLHMLELKATSAPIWPVIQDLDNEAASINAQNEFGFPCEGVVSAGPIRKP